MIAGNRQLWPRVGAAAALALAAWPASGSGSGDRVVWSQAELAAVRSLWIGSLPHLPTDRSNAVSDDPRAARLGKQLFYDARFSANGQVSCATCHKPELAFTDGLRLARGVGTASRNTPTIIGSAYSPWFFWDGRRDSQWAQVSGPMESGVEHGGTRTQYARLIAADRNYRPAYRALFGDLPDLSDTTRFPVAAGPVDDPAQRAAWRRMAPADRDAVTRVFANIGKAIAAYERRVLPGPSRFDRYAAAMLSGNIKRARALFTPDEEAGLRLFIGRGRCLRCHNGPLFTNDAFHNTGLPDPPDRPPDRGRLIGVREVVKNEFNCLGRYSDAPTSACGELRFVKTDDPHFDRGFKTPTLRNVSRTAPYMHDGRFADLATVLRHYNRAPRQPVGETELVPLGLSRPQLAQLEKFLRTLDNPPTVAAHGLQPSR